MNNPAPTPRRNPLAIDLFSGCGGLTQGLKDAGYRVVAAVEIDGKAREVYRANHEEVGSLYGDIRETDPVSIMSKLGLERGALDLVAGCPPCQAFSRIRKRNRRRTVRDQRNALIDEFLRFVLAFRPKSVMMENVAGMATYHRFLAFVTALRERGYGVNHTVMDVQDFEVAQRRRRLILLAALGHTPEFAAPSDKRLTVRQMIGCLPSAGSSGDPLHDLPERRSQRVLSLLKAIPRDGGSRGDLPPSAQLACHRRLRGFHDVYGRMRWDEVAPTITAGCHNPSKGRFVHPEQHRAVTLREAALLQGFPLAYRFDVAHGKEALASMIGNALPPPFIRAHAKALAEQLTAA